MAQKTLGKIGTSRSGRRTVHSRERPGNGFIFGSFDILGSLAHISMLQSIGLLTAEELKQPHRRVTEHLSGYRNR